MIYQNRMYLFTSPFTSVENVPTLEIYYSINLLIYIFLTLSYQNEIIKNKEHHITSYMLDIAS